MLSLVGHAASSQVMNKLCRSDVGLNEWTVKRQAGASVCIPADRSTVSYRRTTGTACLLNARDCPSVRVSQAGIVS